MACKLHGETATSASQKGLNDELAERADKEEDTEDNEVGLMGLPHL